MSPEIAQITEEQIDTVYSIIEKDAKWLLDTYKMHHWVDYYTRSKIAEKYDSGAKIFLLRIDDLPIATITLGNKAPEYYTVNDSGVNGSAINYIDKFLEPSAEALYITALAVDPEHHGKGYASKMLGYVENYAKDSNINYLRFDAKGDYNELISFYLKKGYRIVGEMLDDGDIYFLFEKEIVFQD